MRLSEPTKVATGSSTSSLLPLPLLPALLLLMPSRLLTASVTAVCSTAPAALAAVRAVVYCCATKAAMPSAVRPLADSGEPTVGSLIVLSRKAASCTGRWSKM
jgi:hypothetical protein